MQCPHCQNSQIIKKSFYFVKVLRSFKRRYLCKTCNKTFSSQTFSPTYFQKKPHLNEKLLTLLMHGNTLRGSARILNCNKNTTDRKFQWLIKYKNYSKEKMYSPVIYIDEMESIEHTKLKPLTIPLCTTKDFKIVAINVGKIPAKGHLAEVSKKKYGYRANEREIKLKELFKEIKESLSLSPEKIVTDGSPLYKKLVHDFFPESVHEVVISRSQKEKKRDRIFNNEVKKVFDPMFALNQRCAKLRADVRRLTRKSWCTTKKVENLYHHLKLYQEFNNLKPLT